MNKAFEGWQFKKITLEMMMEYISANAPEDKAWFKSVALSGGKYQHLVAVRAFCSRYCPELLPVAKKKKANKSDLLANW